MNETRQKIPLLLKLKRFKNSKPVRQLNSFISKLKPPKKFPGIPKRILIFRNDRIGDAMVTLPVIRDIKLNYPQTIIDIIPSKNNEFIFREFNYDDNIININVDGNETGLIYKIPLVGGIILAMKYIILPFIFSAKFRRKIAELRKNKYDYAADLVGLKRNAFIAWIVSPFTAGPGRLLPFLFYNYYSAANWVTAHETDFMTRKIENFFAGSTGMNFKNRNFKQPLLNRIYKQERKFDIIFHFGTTALRKLSYEKEEKLIDAFSELNIIVTDSKESETFNKLKNKFEAKPNITFRLYSSLNELAGECASAELLFCYDGGQAHYLSQYVRTVTVFGPGSAVLWKPYEFADYEELCSDTRGGKAIVSQGKFIHIAVFRPMWCNPCFDTGCRSKPCLGDLTAEFIIKAVNEGFRKN